MPFDECAGRGTSAPRPAPACPPSPALWVRFYEFGTGKPIFGERDRTIHYDGAELSRERRNGYGWFNSLPAGLFPLHARWKQAHAGVK